LILRPATQEMFKKFNRLRISDKPFNSEKIWNYIFQKKVF
jgi:hypothetical protein